MSITRRGVLALAGGLAAGAGCTACSPGPGSASPSIGPSATATARPALSVWHRAEGADGVQQALLRWADAYPAAEVTLTSVEADYERVTAAALATASPPDVFEWTTGPTLDMIRAGQVVDLTDAVGDDASDFAPAVIERLTHQGRLWAVPQAVDVQLLYYRKSLLAKAGLQPPETLGQLTAAAKSLTASGMGGLYAGSDRGLGALGGLLIGAAGLRQVSPDGRTPAFDEPALHDAADAFAALLNSPGVLRSASTEWTDAAPFIENECAMQWGGLWDLTRVLAAHAGDVGVLPFPAATPAGRQVVRLTAPCACVGVRTPDAAAARAYVQALWVDDEAKQIEFSTAYSTRLPAKPKLIGLAAKTASGVGAEAARFATEFGQVDSLFWTPASSTAYATALANVVRGRDAATEFAAAAATVAVELKRLAG